MCASPTQTSGVARAELGGPGADRLVRDAYAALGQQLLDVAQAEMEAKVQPDGVADDLDRVAIPAIRRHLTRCSRGRRHQTILRTHRQLDGAFVCWPPN